MFIALTNAGVSWLFSLPDARGLNLSSASKSPTYLIPAVTML